MDCRQCQDEMTAYLDGELPPATSELVRVHVERCQFCADEFQGLEESSAFIDTRLNALELRPQIWGHVRARISAEPAGARPGLLGVFLGHRWVVATATLAAVAILALGIWSFRQRQVDQRDLEQYMSDYLQFREQQEQRKQPRLLVPPQDLPEDSGNPFMSIRATMIDNPFRQEAK
jgi:anti-sigma factor RsiW